MYQSLLTNRYLTTRVIPLIAVAAVALCTALVIIVVSVMSGFVNMVRDAGKTLLGDVVISYSIQGLAHYDELILRIEALPEASAASPLVEMFGLLELPYGAAQGVQVFGIEPISFDQVTGYAASLYWKTPDDVGWLRALRHATENTWKEREARFSVEVIADAERAASGTLRKTLYALAPEESRDDVLALPLARMRDELPGLLGFENWSDLFFVEPMLNPNLDLVYEHGRVLDEGGDNGAAIVTGIEVSDANERRSDGTYRPLASHLWMPITKVTLTLAPISRGNRILQPESRIFPVANEIQFGIYPVDNQRVLIPIAIAQKMLQMDAGQIVDPDELDPVTLLPTVIEETPARVTKIVIRAADGVTPEDLKASVEMVYDTFRAELTDAGDPYVLPEHGLFTTIKTWQEQNAEWIAPVEKERDLMRILFSIIYFVCGGLVLVIFWAIVYEKTRDIGILRSIGASRIGVLWIFVHYGLVVGIVGSIVGVGLAYLVVHNINGIHLALGQPVPFWARATGIGVTTLALLFTLFMTRRPNLLPVVAGALCTITLIGISTWMMLHKGFLVWDPKVYYFSEIPNRMDAANAIITMVGAVVFSIIGALFPAARAADIDPVTALRYE